MPKNYSGKIEMPLVPVLADMELHGVRLDTAALEETSHIFTQRMRQYEQEIYEPSRRKFQHFKSETGWRYLVWQTPDYGKA